MGLLVFAMAADVRAGASDGQWTYSRMITVINGSTQALAQYQVGITVPYEEGMRGDFGDLRFQDAEGNELSYWTASQTDGVEAHVWVKAPELVAEGMAVWRMLFGNDAAESASDFDATMTKGSVQDGLVGCWHMDEGQGVVLEDSSGQSNQLQLAGATWMGEDSRFGSGSRLYFDGSVNSYARLNPLKDFAATEMTVALWMKTGDTNREGSVFSYASSSTDNEILAYNYKSMTPHVRNMHTNSGVAFNDGTWTHMAMTWRSSDGAVVLYKNGVPVFTRILATGVTLTSGGSLVLAQEQDSIGGGFQATQAFQGEMDEVRLYRRALSAAEVRALAEYRESAVSEPVAIVGDERIENVPGGWMPGWGFRRSFTLDSGRVDEALADFPVLVRLTSDNFDFGAARADGFDVRFTLADGTVLDYERERHDAAGQKAEYWVRLPEVSSTADTTFYLTYGNPLASNGEQAAGVWDRHVRARYGMGDAGSAQINDSTTNANHAAKRAVDRPQAAEGLAGWAQEFNGISDYLEAPHAASLNLSTAITVSAWVYKPGSWESAYQKIVGKCRTDGGEYAYGLSQASVPYGTFFFQTISGTLRSVAATSHPTADAWHQLVGTYDGAAMNYYVDGALAASVNYSGTLTGNTHPLRVGHAYNEEYFRGGIDEVRISDVARNPAWIQADYHGGAGSLLAAGPVEVLQVRHFISGVVKDVATGEGVAGVSLLSREGAVLATSDFNGHYAFEFEAGWSGSLIPVYGNGRFDPSSRSYTNMTGSLNSQNFLLDTGVSAGAGCLGGSFSEAMDACYLTVAQGGNAGWVVQTNVTHDGVSAVKSGTIGNSQESWFQTTVTGPGTLTFWWKVSSEACCDPLTFYVNGVSQGDIRGNIDWQMKTYALTAGVHTLKWRYSKDGSVSGGSDAAYVDQVAFAPDSITATLSNLTQDYTGAPRVPTVVTDPPGYPYELTYDGSPEAPSEIGSYAVTATVLGEEKAAGTLVIQAPANISGRVINADTGAAVQGLRMEFSDGEFALTDETGAYAKHVRPGWNGVLRPADIGGLRYEPPARVYEAITGSLPEQNFSLVPGFSVMKAAPTGRVTQVIGALDVTFFKDVNFASVTAGDVVLTGPSGTVVPTAMEALNAATIRITVPAQSEDGEYVCVIGPAIQSADGEAMDQNRNGTGGEAGDTYTFSFTIDQAMDLVSIDPATGPTYGGTEVTITGLGLTGGFGSGADGDVAVNEDVNLSVHPLASGRTCPDAVGYAVVGLTDRTATLSEAPAAGGLASGDEVLLIHLQGTPSAMANAGQYEYLRVASVSGPVVTFARSKANFYGEAEGNDENIGLGADQQKVRLQRVPQYRNVTVASNGVLTASAWDGTQGGVLCFRASGTVLNNGSIHMDAKGYRGGQNTFAGESVGASGTETQTANAGGGGCGAGSSCHIGGGGGGGHGQNGTGGYSSTCAGQVYTNGAGNSGQGGFSYGVSNLVRIYPGSGGGGGVYNTIPTNGVGGSGGGIVMISGRIIQNNGEVRSAGGPGADADYLTPRGAYSDSGGGGGGGSGGSILLNAETYLLATNSVGINGGAGGIGRYNGKNSNGGSGSAGRLVLLYTGERPEEGVPSQAFVESAPGAVSVFFGTNRAWSVMSVSPTRLTAITPPGEAGSVDVTVEVSGHGEVTRADGFTYVEEEDLIPPAAPVILNCATAPATNELPQPPVQLTGTRLELSAVWVNGVKCANQGEGAWSYEDPQMSSGLKEYLVYATDPAGNTSETVRVIMNVRWDKVIDADMTLSATNVSWDGKDILVSGATLTLDGEHSFGRVVVTNGGKIACAVSPSAAETNRVHLEARYVYVSTNSSIDVSATSRRVASVYGVGGSHGGRGVSPNANVSAPAYGSMTEPVDAGMMGGGYGGGALFLRADELVLEGALRANGQSSSSGGGSAGGSIWVDAGVLSGSGTIQAVGGGGSYSLGAGGGGRIAIYYGDAAAFQPAQVSAAGGARYSSYYKHGGAGTVYWKDKQAALGRLVVDNTPRVAADSAETELSAPVDMPLEVVNANLRLLGDHVFTQPVEMTGFVLSHTGSLSLASANWTNGVWNQNGRVGIPDLALIGVTWNQNGTAAVERLTLNSLIWHQNETIEVTDTYSPAAITWHANVPSLFPFGDRLVVDGYTYINSRTQAWDAVIVTNGGKIACAVSPSAAETNRVHLEARYVYVSTNSSIDVSATSRRVASVYGVGGSHGGRGVSPNANVSAPAYGSMTEPVDAGMMGGGYGGGALFLRADELVLEGALRANGQSSSSGGGSAGGSIWVDAGVLSGSGTIQAVGGGGSYSLGAGGGGRIAIYYGDAAAFQPAQVSAAGGARYSSYYKHGGAGTVYWKDKQAALGRLVVDNTPRVAADSAETELSAPVAMPLEVVNANVLLLGDHVFTQPVEMTGFVLSHTGTVAAVSLAVTNGTWAQNGTATVEQLRVGGVAWNQNAPATVSESLTQTGFWTWFHRAVADMPFGNQLVISNMTLVARLPLEWDSIAVSHAGKITSEAMNGGQTNAIAIVARHLYVTTNSIVDATGLGWTGTNKTGGAGGSHGGLGGVYNTSQPPATYGEYLEPVAPGMGGAPSNTSIRGGGVIRITADELVLDGVLRANGSSSGSGGYGAAAGGSIWLDLGTLNGVGRISANGGAQTYYGGGGGGGRVAVYYNEAPGFDLENITARGGNGHGGGGAGGDGTVHVEARAAWVAVRQVLPAEWHNQPLTSLVVSFNVTIDEDSFTPQDVVVSGPSGTLAVAGVSKQDAVTYVAELAAPASADGLYSYMIGPEILSTNGMGMGAGYYGEVRVDRTAPAVPVVTNYLSLESGTNRLAATTAILRGTREDETEIWGNGVRRVTLGSGSWAWTVSLQQGVNTLHLQARDPAGNDSPTRTVVFLVDTVAPQAGAALPANNAYLGVSPETVSLAFVEQTSGLDLAATAKSLKRGGVTEMPGTWNVQSNRLVFAPQGALLDGTYMAEVQLRDQLGNAGAVQLWSFTVDTAPPAAPDVDPVSTPTSIGQQTLTGRREAYGAVLCNGATVAVSSASTIWTWTTPLAVGANEFSFTVKDRAGNESPATTVSIWYDNVAPGNVPLTAAVQGNGTQLTLDWSVYDELSNGGDIVRYEVYSADAPFTSIYSAQAIGTVPSGQKSFVVSNLQRNVTRHYGVVAVDAGGLVSPTVNSIPAAPVDVVPPADPAQITFECGWTNLTVHWSASADADGDLAGYLVSFPGDADPTGTAAGQTFLARGDLQAATSYAVRVQARDTTGNAGAGLVVTGYTLVTNPVWVAATPLSGALDVEWAASTPAQHVESYRIFVAPEPFTSVSGRTAAATVTGLTASVAGLVNGTEYHVGVAAVNRSGGMADEVQTAAATPQADTEGPVLHSFTYESAEVTNGLRLRKPGTFRVEVSDRGGIAGAQLAWNGRVQAMETSNGTHFIRFWNVSAETDGWHVVTVTVLDTFGNATVQTNQVQVQLAAPVQVPTITSPLPSARVNQAHVTVTGQADPYAQSVRVYRGADLAGEGAIQSGAYAVPVELVEGTNSLRAAAVNRGGEGPRSGIRAVILDTGIPSAPIGVQAEAHPSGVVRLSWWAPLNTDVAGYRVFRSAADFASTSSATQVHSGLLTSTVLDDLPVADGDYVYRVQAVNSLGSSSELSASAAAISDRTPPAVVSAVYTTSGQMANGVYGTGTVHVALTLSEPLQSTPFFSLASSNGAPLAITLSGTGTTYEGSFHLGPEMGSGVLYAVFSGRDQVGNRGTDVRIGDRLPVDTAGPSATGLSLTPAGPIANDPSAPVTVGVQISFDGNDLPVGTPRLTWSLSESQSLPADVALSRATLTTWAGDVTLPATAGQSIEWLEFAYEGVDALGNRSTTMAGERRAMVYQGSLPPADSPLGLKAEAGPGGQVTLSWHAVDEASAYAVLRRAPGETELAFRATSSALSWQESVSPDGEYWYAVASVRTANGGASTSAVSEAVAVTADSEAPDSPSDLRLMLYGQGIAATWTPPEGGTVRYRLYRSSNSFAGVEGLAPLIANIASTNAVDSQPMKGPAYYAVTALDPAGNESPPSSVVYTNLSLLPVNSLHVKRRAGQAPLVTWIHPSPTGLAGYNLYVGATGLTYRVNDSLVSRLVQSWVDEGYTQGNRWYGVSAEDGVKDGVVRRLLAPGIRIRRTSADSLVRGWMNRLTYEVSNESGTDLSGLSLSVALGGKTHVSDPFGLATGETKTVPVVAGGYANLAGWVVATNTVTYAPNAGESLTQDAEELLWTRAGALVMTVQPEGFVRGAEGAVRFTLHNISDVEIEVVTARNSGSAASADVTCQILDAEGMVYATASLKQMTGNGVVTLPNGTTVARIPAGASFESGPIPVVLPDAVPAQVVAQVRVAKIHYRYGDASAVTLDGPLGRTLVDMRETDYYALITNVMPRVSTGHTNIVIQGLARRRGTEAPAAQMPVKLILSQSGFDRTYQLTTDDQGQWQHVFTPTAGDAGVFTVVALHPTVTERSGAQTFTIQRVSLSPAFYSVNCPRDFNAPVAVTVSTGPGTTLTNLTLEYRAVDQAGGVFPPGIVLTNRSTIGVLGPRAAGKLTATFRADSQAPASGQLILRICSGDETWGAMTVSYTLGGQVLPVLRWSPSSIETGVAISNRRVERVTLRNTGYQALSNAVATLLPVGTASLEWATLASASARPVLEPGASWDLDMSFQPGPDVALTLGDPYGYILRVAADNHAPFEVPVWVHVDASGRGNALIRATDLYTGTLGANGQPVAGLAGATVRMIKQDGLLFETNAVTDAAGEAWLTGLPAGQYVARVTAPNHTANSVPLWVKPGATTVESVHLSMSLITVEWSVTPTTIQDVYTINLNATYETKVPAAVVSVEPRSIPLPGDMKAGDVFNGELRMRNLGLLRAEEVAFELPASDDRYHFELLNPVPETIEASQEVRVPYRVVCLRAFDDVAETDGGGGCRTYSSCGNVRYCYKCINGVVESAHSSAACVYLSSCDSGTPSLGSGGGSSGSGGWDYGSSSSGGGSSSSSATPAAPSYTFDPACVTSPSRETNEPEMTCGIVDAASPVDSYVEMVLRSYHDYVQDFEIPAVGGPLRVKRTYMDNQWSFRVGPHEDIVFHDDRVVPDLSGQVFSGWYVDESGAIRMSGGTPSAGELYDPLGHPEAMTYRNMIVERMLDRPCQTVIAASSSSTGQSGDGTSGGSAVAGQVTLATNAVERDGRTEFMSGCADYRWYDRRGNWAEFDGLKLESYGDRNGVTTRVLRDEWGRITGYLDHFGRQIVWMSYVQFDVQGQATTNVVHATNASYLASVRDAQGRGVQYQYSASGLLTNVLDAASNATAYVYQTDTGGVSRLVHKKLPGGKEAWVRYDAHGYVAAVSNNQGGRMQYQYSYDSTRDRYYAQSRDEAGVVEERWFDQSGNLVAQAVNGVQSSVQTNDDPRATYDEHYNLVRYEYPDGAADEWTYSELWPLPVAGAEWNGLAYTNEYDANFNLLRETTRLNGVVIEDIQYAYDDYGNRLSATLKGMADRPDLTWRWTYDDRFRPVTETDPWGNVQTNTYDVHGHLVAARLRDGNLWQYAYDAAGRVLAVRDPQGGVVSNRYDAAGRMIWMRDPRGVETWSTYASNGLLVAVSNSLGETERREYDALGRVIRDVHADGRTTDYQYDARGRRIVAGREPVVERDAQGRIVRLTQPGGDVYEFSFDGDSEWVREMRTPSLRMIYDHDDKGQLLQQVTVGGDRALTNRWAYNAVGRLTEETDAAGRKYEYRYDANHLLSAVIDPMGFTNRYDHGTPFTLDVWTDARGYTNRFAYAYTQQAARVTYPDGSAVTSRTDVFGRPVEQVLPGGRTIRTAYGPLGRLESIAYHPSPAAPAGQTAAFTRDAVGRVTGYGTQGDTHQVAIAYDDAARRRTLTTHFGGFSVTQAYLYDRQGRKTAYVDALGRTNLFAYGPDNRPESVTVPDVGMIRLVYMAGQAQEMRLPGGTLQRMTLDSFGQIRSNQVWDPAGQPVLDAAYDYNAAGQVATAVVDGRTTTYAYDANGQLTGVQEAGGERIFAYDGNQNRLSDSAAAGAWVHDPVNRLTTRPGVQYAYNAEGAVTQRVANGITWAYEYNLAGKLVEVRSNGLTVARYAYDPAGRRVSKETGGATTYYLYSDEGLAAELDAAGTVRRTYLHGPSTTWMRAPLLLQENGQTFFYLRDRHGMAEKLVTASGAVAWSAQRSAFGQVQVDPASTVANPLRFSGQYEDAETGLHYNTFRYYDPEAGRYLTPDPMGFKDGINRYQFAFNDPVNRMDPWGLYAADVHFYGTYIVARKAGMSKDAAFSLAYGAQYPDGDTRVDALSIAADRALKPWHRDQFSTFEWRDKALPILHMLHGKDRQYTECNRCVLAQLIRREKDPLKKGMMIHVWQDTYGHLDIERGRTEDGSGYQIGNKRYKWYTTDGAYSSLAGHVADGTAPDVVILRPELAKECLRELYSMLGGKDPSAMDDVDTLIDELAEVGPLEDPHAINPMTWLWMEETSAYAEDEFALMAADQGLYDVKDFIQSGYDPHDPYDPYAEDGGANFRSPTLSDADLKAFVENLGKTFAKECR